MRCAVLAVVDEGVVEHGGVTGGRGCGADSTDDDAGIRVVLPGAAVVALVQMFERLDPCCR